MAKWFKLAVKIIVVILCLLLVWRVLFAESKSTLGDILPTKGTAEIYNASGTLNVLTNKVADEISEGGYFSVYGVFYTPDTGELQVTVRYNDSTTDSLGDISFYAYTVDTSGEPVQTDADGAEGNATGTERLHEGYPIGEILTPTSMGTEEKLFYNYEKLLFSGVEIGKDTNVIISLCADGDPEAEKAVIAAHFAEQEMKTYKLSRSEKKALASYTE